MRQLILTIGAAVLLSGCGPRWMYTNLDWLIPWYVDDYIELDPHQDDELAARLARQLDWHCRTQMPRYALFLRQLREELRPSGQSVSAARWAEHFEQLKRYWIDLIHQLGPDAVAILVTASDEQLDTLFENLEKTNLELERKYVDPGIEARRHNRQKRIQERIAYWTGPLTKAQKERLADWAAALVETAEDWLDHRRQFQAALRQELDRRNEGEAFQRRFLNLLAAPERSREASYQEKIDINKRLTFQMLEALSMSLTPAQRQHIVNRLDKLAQEMEQLACDPVPATHRKAS